MNSSIIQRQIFRETCKSVSWMKKDLTAEDVIICLLKVLWVVWVNAVVNMPFSVFVQAQT